MSLKLCEACGKPLAKNCQKQFRFHPECQPSHPKRKGRKRICLVCLKPFIAVKWNHTVHQGKCREIRDARNARAANNRRWQVKHTCAALPDREYKVHGMEFCNSDWD